MEKYSKPLTYRLREIRDQHHKELIESERVKDIREAEFAEECILQKFVKEKIDESVFEYAESVELLKRMSEEIANEYSQTFRQTYNGDITGGYREEVLIRIPRVFAKCPPDIRFIEKVSKEMQKALMIGLIKKFNLAEH